MSTENILTHQEETTKLLNVTDQSERIYLQGSLSEKKEQLLKKLQTINTLYTNRKRDN
ncbi:MAG: hypothetical protein ACI8WB_005098 [Phenylobacterium sp.]|jgi:hypothetical protein